MSISLVSPNDNRPPRTLGASSWRHSARDVVRVVVALTVGSLFAEHAQSESLPQLLAELDSRSSIADAVTQSRLLEPTKLHRGVWPTPRSNEPPALTGTEGFSLSALRASLRAAPYYSTLTAQDVQDRVDGRADGGEGQSKVVIEIVGWAILKLNWARATLLADIDAADRFEGEARKVASSVFRLRGADLLEYWTGLRSADPKVPEGGFYRWASLQYGFIVQIASIVERESVALPDAFDPEGYVRQTLEHTSQELTRTADRLLVLTDSMPEAFR